MLKHIIRAFQWLGRLALSIVAGQVIRWAIRHALEWLE